MGRARRIAGIATTEQATAEHEPADLPWPGDELVSRVAAGVDRAAFYESGRQSVRDLQAVLATVERSLDSYRDIFDFGCGCGRIMLWLQDLAATSSLHGSDVDARAVRWAQENLPWARFTVNQTAPPLDYPDQSFDLVYNHSVFTHLDEEHQDLWLAELWRVTRPGGHLVLSVHGERPLVLLEEASRNAGGDPSHLRRELERDGIAFIRHDAFTGGPHDAGYHSTYHAPWYVFEHWSRFFEIRAYVTSRSLGYQDFVLLERRPADTAVPRRAESVLRRVAATETAARSTPTAPAGPAALPEVARAVALSLDGPAVDAPARYGPASVAARRAALRLLDNYAGYQRQVDQSLVDAVRALDGAVADLSRRLDDLQASVRVDGVLTLQESNGRLWDSMARQGERVNRLEADLWEAIDALRPPPAGEAEG